MPQENLKGNLKGNLTEGRSRLYEQLRRRLRLHSSQNSMLYMNITSHLASVHKNQQKMQTQKIRAPAPIS